MFVPIQPKGSNMQQPESILSSTKVNSDISSKTAKQPDRKKINADPEKPAIVKDQNPIDETYRTRPHKYTPDELQNLIDEYFLSGGTKRKVIVGNGANKQIRELNIYTLTGMCLYCGFCDKNELFQLERNNRYTSVIKRARSRIEQIYEENLQSTGNSANIFALKNFGWVDRQEIVQEDRTIKLDV